MFLLVFTIFNTHYYPNDRRKLRSQTSDCWTHATTVVSAVKDLKESKKKVREKVESHETHCVFPILRGSGGSQSRLPIFKRRVRSHLVGWDIRFGAPLEVEMFKTCTPLWREDARGTFGNTPQLRSALEKVQASVTWSTFWRTLRC